MGEANRRTRKHVRIEDQGPGTYYVRVSLDPVLEAGTREQFEAVLRDLSKKGAPDGCGPTRDPEVACGWVLRWGPFVSAEAAEVEGRRMHTMIVDTLGKPREVDSVLETQRGGAYIDPRTRERSRPPPDLRAPPPDLEARKARAETLAAHARELGADHLDLLIAAHAHTLAQDEHPIAFVQRARAVAQWLDPDAGEQTPLAVLEQKRQALAGVIASYLSPRESFVLLLANQGEGGSLTHVSTMPRDTTMALVRGYLAELGEIQSRRQ